eukprot:scaffold7192_cov204-Ochromonas_danica.AAC.3
MEFHLRSQEQHKTTTMRRQKSNNNKANDEERGHITMEVACVAALIQLVLSAFMVAIDEAHDDPQMMGWRRLI